MRPCPHCEAGHRATRCTDGMWHLYDAGGTYKCAPIVSEAERMAAAETRIAELEAALATIRDLCAERATHDRVAAVAIAAISGVGQR